MQNLVWIECSSKLPTDRQLCIGYRKLTKTFSLVYYSEAIREWLFFYQAEVASDITHWAVLTPPEES